MSYTSEDQELKEPIKDLLLSINDVNERINNRINNSNNWDKTHIIEINEFRKKLFDIQLDIKRMNI